mmetsp:Transcript_39088/g.97886  ORF Transcript_39088/g.97886 Transcript_39088/m.97886 type:complete len:249 (-) Transcript_39088:160-906(-)
MVLGPKRACPLTAESRLLRRERWWMGRFSRPEIWTMMLSSRMSLVSAMLRARPWMCEISFPVRSSDCRALCGDTSLTSVMRLCRSAACVRCWHPRKSKTRVSRLHEASRVTMCCSIPRGARLVRRLCRRSTNSSCLNMPSSSTALSDRRCSLTPRYAGRMASAERDSVCSPAVISSRATGCGPKARRNSVMSMKPFLSVSVVVIILSISSSVRPEVQSIIAMPARSSRRDTRPSPFMSRARKASDTSP